MPILKTTLWKGQLESDFIMRLIPEHYMCIALRLWHLQTVQFDSCNYHISGCAIKILPIQGHQQMCTN